MAKHPEVERKVRAEIEEFMKEEDYSYENLKNFTYIDNVEKETTRFYGPGNLNFLRVALKDHYVKEVLIRKGTLITNPMMGVHYSEKYYKNPNSFRPERWESECDNIPTFAIGGFSAGPRTCIGKHLAKLEAKIGLIKFLKRYERIELASFVLRSSTNPKA